MRQKPTAQHYDAYMAEDRMVWETLYNRQMNVLQNTASKLYLQAVDDIQFTAGEIPDFKKINEILQPLTGWQLKVAPCLVPEDEFFPMLSQRIFPATCWLRTMEELDYLEEPDMFHDVFGHAPLLTNKEYADFMQQFGALALKWMHHPAAIKMIARLYWFSIEFGMIKEEGQPRIFGAGIMSSLGEVKYALSDMPDKRNFNMQEMLLTHYRTDVLQDTYFIIESFSQLCAVLPKIDRILEHTWEMVT